MERRRNLARRVAPAGLALLVMVGLSGCGGNGPVGRSAAAVVDGHTISEDEVLSLVKAYTAQAQVELAKGGADNPNLATFENLIEQARGDGAGTYGTGAASNALEQLITYQLVVAELEANDIEVTDDDVDAARATIEETLDPEAKESVSEDLVTFTARSRAAEEKLGELVAKQEPAEEVEPLSPEELEEQVQARFDEFVETAPYCISVAWALDDAGAQTLRDRVEAGEEFSAVAAQTVDPSSGGPGGFYGCGSADQLAQFVGEDVAAAQTGDLFGPFDPSQGQGQAFGVAHIDSITGAVLDDVRPEIEQQIQDEQAQAMEASSDPTAKVAARKAELAEKAEITISSRYGTWDGSTGRVIPPVDPTATTTTIPEIVATEPAGS